MSWPRPRTPLAGRQPELEVIRKCAMGAAALITVAGEPGVGRTRLIEEALELPQLARHRRLIGRCYPLRDSAPLGVVGDAVGWTVPPSKAAASAAAELLARSAPAVLVLDDLHWCDPATLRLLPKLLAHLPDGVVLLVSHRSGPAGSATLDRLATAAGGSVAVARIVLPPLGALEVGSVARALTGDEISVAAVAQLRERTGGLPRLVEVASMPQEPCASVDMLRGSLAGLDAATQRVVDAAAVLGSFHDTSVLAAVAGLSRATCDRALGRAIDEGALVQVGERLGLRAPMAAAALSGSIPAPLRSRMHRRAVRSLEALRPRPWVELARHRRELGQTLEWARAVDAATRGLADVGLAVELIREVVTEPGFGVALRARLASRLAAASLRAQAPGPARPLLQRVVDELVPPGVGRADLRFDLGLLHLAVGDAAGWRDQRLAAIEDLRRRPDRAALAMVELAMPWVEQGRVDEHRLWLARAVTAAAQQHDPGVTVCVTAATALVPLYTGDPSGWAAMEAIPWEAPLAEERLQLLWAAENLGGACFHLGHYTRARGLWARAALLAAELERQDARHVLRAGEVSLAWATGGWDGLEPAARDYIEENAELPAWAMHGRMVLGHLLLSRGALDEAARLLQEAAAAAQAGGALPSVAAAAGGLARISLARGEVAAARATAVAALELLARKGIWAWVAPVAPPAVESLIATGRVGEAASLVAKFAAGLRGRDAPLARAALRCCRGLVLAAEGDHARAAASLGGAVRLYGSLPRPYEAATAALQRGISLVETGDTEGGREVLRSSLADFDGLGACFDADRVRRALRERAVVVAKPWMGGRSGYGTSLSPRQRAVAERAAAGRTNQQIARELFISEKTVEDHLAGALAKLGFSSRRALRDSRVPGADPETEKPSRVDGP